MPAALVRADGEEAVSFPALRHLARNLQERNVQTEASPLRVF